MSKILGVDNGYRFTKTSKGICLGSSITKGIDVYNKDVIQVKIGNQDYIVGEEDGEYISDADKLKTPENKENLKVCTLTAIGLSFPNDPLIEITFVGGLPAGFFKDQRILFENEIRNMTGTIYINKIGFEQTIIIKDVFTFPQSAGIVFSKASEVKKDTSLVIDIGGGTWDVTSFNGLKMLDAQTYQEGMLVLDTEIAQHLNNNYYTNYEPYQIYDLKERGYFTVDGEKKSMNETHEIIKKHVANLEPKLKRQFNYNQFDHIFLIGGGAAEIRPYLEQYMKIENSMENEQFSNANCYELMGKMALSNKNK